MDENEFVKLVAEANLGRARFAQQCEEVFRSSDADASGGIDVDELAAAFIHLRLDVTREEIEALVDQYDVDCSGQLDKKEFVALCRDAKEGVMATADDAALEGGAWTPGKVERVTVN